MKAVVVREFGPPEVMKLEEVPNPTPGPGQVVVRARAIGVRRCASDLIDGPSIRPVGHPRSTQRR